MPPGKIGKIKSRPAKKLLGDLDAKEVNKVLRTNSETVKSCAELVYRANAATKGALDLKFTINAKGKITKTEATKNEVGAVARRCVTGRLKTLSFPSSAGDSVMEKNYRFIPAE